MGRCSRPAHDGAGRGGTGRANIALRDRIDKGELSALHHPSGRSNAADAGGARAAVHGWLDAKGVKHTGEIGLTPEPAPPQAEIEVLKAIVDEAKKAGVQVNVHAVSSPAMAAAVDAGVTRLVHLPNKDFTTYEQAEKVAQAGAIVAGLIAFGAPNIDSLSGPPAQVQWPKDNTARFRDGKPCTEHCRAIRTRRSAPRVPRRLHDHQPRGLGCRRREPPRTFYSTDQNAAHRVTGAERSRSASCSDGRHPPHHRRNAAATWACLSYRHARCRKLATSSSSTATDQNITRC